MRLRYEQLEVIRYPLYTDTDWLESLSTTLRTLRQNIRGIAALMADQLLLRTRMVCQSDVTLWTRRKIPTILADPSTT